MIAARGELEGSLAYIHPPQLKLCMLQLDSCTHARMLQLRCITDISCMQACATATQCQRARAKQLALPATPALASDCTDGSSALNNADMHTSRRRNEGTHACSQHYNFPGAGRKQRWSLGDAVSCRPESEMKIFSDSVRIIKRLMSLKSSH